MNEFQYETYIKLIQSVYINIIHWWEKIKFAPQVKNISFHSLPYKGELTQYHLHTNTTIWTKLDGSQHWAEVYIPSVKNSIYWMERDQFPENSASLMYP